MGRFAIGFFLIVGLLFCPGSKIYVPLKKACCCSSELPSNCSHQNDCKPACCQTAFASAPIVLGLANDESFIHPNQPREVIAFSDNYSARYDAPPSPPPKVA
jgi:hypothetical protein